MKKNIYARFFLGKHELHTIIALLSIMVFSLYLGYDRGGIFRPSTFSCVAARGLAGCAIAWLLNTGILGSDSGFRHFLENNPYYLGMFNGILFASVNIVVRNEKSTFRVFVFLGYIVLGFILYSVCLLYLYRRV